MAPGIQQKVAQWVNLEDMEPRNVEQARLPDNVQGDERQQQRAKTMAAYTEGRKILSDNLEGLQEDDLLSPMCPYNVRATIIASYNAKVQTKKFSDSDYIRFKNLWDGALVGAAFSLAARVFRVVIRVAFFWLSMLIALYQQSTYAEHMPPEKKYNIVAEDLRRIGYEFIDLFASGLTTIIGIVNFVAPNAISTDWLRDYYIRRIDDVRDKNATFNAARQKYFAEENLRHAIGNNRQPEAALNADERQPLVARAEERKAGGGGDNAVGGGNGAAGQQQQVDDAA